MYKAFHLVNIYPKILVEPMIMKFLYLKSKLSNRAESSFNNFMKIFFSSYFIIVFII